MNDEIFVGIDPSLSGTGICIINSNKILHKKLIETSPKEKNKEARLLYIMNEINNSLIEYPNIKNIFIEGLSMGSVGKTDDLAGLHYYIRTKLYEQGFICGVIPPLELKNWAIGITHAPKNIMLKEVYKKWGHDWDADFFDDNICDAFCLAMYSKFLFLNPEENEKRNLKMLKNKELKKKAKQNKRDKKKLENKLNE